MTSNVIYLDDLIAEEARENQIISDTVLFIYEELNKPGADPYEVIRRAYSTHSDGMLSIEAAGMFVEENA